MNRNHPSTNPSQNSTKADRGATEPVQERRRWTREQQTEAEVSTNGAPVPALKPLEFSTRSFPASEQFVAWQAYMEPIAELRLPDDMSPVDGFPADHVAWNLGNVLIVQQRVPAHSYLRSLTKLRASPIDHWSLTLLRSGESWTGVDRQVAHNEAGKVELRTLGHPFRGRTTDAESIILYMPRELFGDASRIFDVANNSILSGNLANLLIEYVNSVEASLRSLVAEDLAGITRTLRDMITACLSAVDRKPVTEKQTVGLMERARRYIHENIASPELVPDRLCHELGISRTRLYHMFEASGGVLHYIRKRRLLAAHAALSDPANSQRILEIAEAAGFDTPANFSRAFKTEFGYTPRDARELATASHSAFRATPLRENTAAFRDWLCALGH